MREKYNNGDTVFFISNGTMLQECRVVKDCGDMCILAYPSYSFGGGITQLRKNRIYRTKEDAAKDLKTIRLPAGPLWQSV